MDDGKDLATDAATKDVEEEEDVALDDDDVDVGVGLEGTACLPRLPLRPGLISLA